MAIAAEVCVFTNDRLTVETIRAPPEAAEDFTCFYSRLGRPASSSRAWPRHDDLRRGGGNPAIAKTVRPMPARCVDRAIDAGINFIDTADVYAGGRVAKRCSGRASAAAQRAGDRDQGGLAQRRAAQSLRLVGGASPLVDRRRA